MISDTIRIGCLTKVSLPINNWDSMLRESLRAGLCLTYTSGCNTNPFTQFPLSRLGIHAF